MGEHAKKTILVVDDAPSSHAILKKVFASLYEVLEAENGRHALNILAARSDIAVVVLDIVMPELDGFGVLAAMQGDERMKGIPVIVMTASADEQTQMQALSAGAMDVLYKPINPQVTRKRVENLIARMEAVRLSERNRSMEQELREAETDVISGLYNKNAFLRRTAQYLREYPDGAYILLRWDIDNFKVYNDIYGTEAGNEYLSAVGRYCLLRRDRLSNVILCARYEADHFTFLIDASAFDAEETAKQMTRAIRQQKKRAFDYTPRIGLYRIDDPALDVSLMCDRAYLALRSIKHEYGKRYAWYENDMRDKLIREHEIVSEMNRALADGQFKVYFQPQYHYVTRTLIGVEALARWIHPKKGMIVPAEFIPIFERNGFIYELDRYVWEQACACLAGWRENLALTAPGSISVNISRKDLYRPDMVEQISALPEKYGILPSELHLEITESAYIDHPEQAERVISALREKGFCVEMDDFGSGYSSLNTLKNMPVDVLKLDMKFLAPNEGGGKGGRILGAIIRMAQEIDITVIAEGVETERQAEYLKSIGCHYMQGYLFARPMPQAEFEKLLESGTSGRMEAPGAAVGVDGAAEFLDANTQATLLFNSFVGGAAILEYDGVNLAALRMNDRFYETLELDRKKYARYQYRVLDRFPQQSRDKIHAALRSAIESGGESECETCAYPLDVGGPIWAKWRLRCLSKRQESYLFYLSVENIGVQKQMERALKLEKQVLENLVNSIPGGVATYEVREDGFYLVYASEGTAALSGRTPEEYKRLLFEGRGRNVIYPPDEKQVFTAVNKAVKTGKDVDLNYRILRKGGGYIWVNLRGRVLGEQNGYPLFYAVYHNLSVTTELYQRILDETENVLIVADRKTHELLFVNGAAAKMAGREKDAASGMNSREYFSNWSAPCAYRLTEQLGDEPLSQEIDLNGRHYYSRVTRINWNGRDAYINYIADRTELWNRQKHTDEILRSIPGGVALFHTENGRIMRSYLSEGAAEVLGYQPDEIPLKDMVTGNSRLHPDDMEPMKKAAFATVAEGKPFSMDMRIYTCEGELRWVNLKINPRQTGEDEPYYCGVYSDVTERKRMEEELRVREQEYRIAAAQSGVHVFRYEIAGRIGILGRQIGAASGLPERVPDLPQHMIDRASVPEESRADWLRMFSEIDGGAAEGGIEIQLRMSDGGQRWFRIRFTGILDAEDKPASAVISYVDITKERETLMSVQRLADLDGMTGLYNHAATERRIEQQLSRLEGRPCAFILLDVDDLKHINDCYGHPEGDRALVYIAQTLKKHFRSTDIIGRVGGDEFVILLPGMPDAETLAPSLRMLMLKLSAVRVGGGDEYALHCSLGCTFSRDGSDSFDAVYKRADMALYQIKRSHKNDYSFYGQEMESEGYVYTQHNAVSLHDRAAITPGETARLLDAIAAYYPLVLSVNLTRGDYTMMESAAFVTELAPLTGAWEEFIGRTIETFYPDYRETVQSVMSRQALLDAYAEGKRSLRFTVRQIDRSKTAYRWVEIGVVFCTNVSGDACGFIFVRPTEEDGAPGLPVAAVQKGEARKV